MFHRMLLLAALILALTLVPCALLLSGTQGVAVAQDRPLSPSPETASHAENTTIEYTLFSLVVILLAARIFGELFERINQPPVLGELVAGVVIGGSILKLVHLTPAIDTLAQIGVIILLFEVGLETRLKDMLRVGATSAIVASIGVVCPFFMGYWICRLLNVADGSSAAAIFVGATLTATSVAITAQVLTDIGRLGTDEAKVILGAAVIDDVAGLTILAVVIGILTAGTLEIGNALRITAIACLFLVAALVVGSYSAHRLMPLVGRMHVRGHFFVSALLFCFVFSLIAARAGLATIVGAFVAGVLLDTTYRHPDGREVHLGGRTGRIRPVADLLTPIFFVKMGMLVDLSIFLQTHIVLLALLISLVAIMGKILSGFGGLGKGLNKIAIGLGMVPRGEVWLIFLSYGMAYHIIDSSLYSALLVVVFVSTFITPPLLKIAFERTATPTDIITQQGGN